MSCVTDNALENSGLLWIYVTEDTELRDDDARERTCDFGGLAGVERQRGLRADLVILTMQMPWLNGLGTIRTLRGEFPSWPIISISADGQRLKDALRLRASATITKPSTPMRSWQCGAAGRRPRRPSFAHSPA